MNGCRILVWLCFATVAFAQPADPWLVVPGKSVGPITALTTRADLVRYFGANHVHDEMAGPGGDSEAVLATVVNGNGPGSSVVIFWDKLDSTGKHPDVAAHPDFLRLCYGNEGQGKRHCKWHLANGISIGTSLRELEALNGRGFDLSGFGWDYSGTITDWKGGKLGGELRGCGLVALALEPREANPGPDGAKLLMAVTGDQTFASSDPAMQQVNPVVDSIGVTFADAKGCTGAGSGR